MKRLKVFFMITDLGFILYWVITFLHIIPEAYLFKDYNDSVLVAWNWSFFPLDMCISFSGLSSIILFSKNNPLWSRLALISLTLTFCSGLQAVSFWILRNDFDIMWWMFNLYLLIYPLFFLKKIIKRSLT
jgi:hypothetical protein